MARSGPRRQPSEGWWGLRPRIGRGRGERVLLPDGRPRRGGSAATGYAPLAVRMVLAGLLLYLSVGKLTSLERLTAYSEWLSAGELSPLMLAQVSAYVQAIAAVLLALGLFTRIGALLLVVHSVAMLMMLNAGDLLYTWILPCAMLAGALFLMLRGPGRLALDGLRAA